MKHLDRGEQSRHCVCSEFWVWDHSKMFVCILIMSSSPHGISESFLGTLLFGAAEGPWKSLGWLLLGRQLSSRRKSAFLWR